LNNSSTLNPTDIDRDGILEISQNVEKDPQDLPKGSGVVSWYQWNGKFDKDRKLLKTKNIFYCYDYNFKLNISRYDEKKLSVSRKSDNDDVQYVFSSREFDNHKMDFFKINIINKNSEYYSNLDKNKDNENIENEILYENDDYIYIFRYINKKAAKEKGISFKSIENSFEIINK